MSFDELDLIEIRRGSTGQMRTYSLTRFVDYILSFGAPGSYTDEEARDAIAAALVQGAGITIVVDDGLDTITISSTITQYTDGMADARVAAGIATHEAAGNPHPVYLTQAEGDAAYEVVGAVTTHVGLADPHTQYLLESAFNLSTFTTADLAEGANLYFTNERVDDRIAALFVEGAGIDFVYDDGANTFTVTVDLSELSTTTLPEGSNLYYTDERVDDRVAALIQNGTGITWSYNDGAGTLTPTVTVTQYTDEMVDDRVAALLVEGTNITLTYNDGANTLTIDAAGGASSPLRGYIWGLTLSNAADANNDITVAAGEATSETHDELITLAAAITKQLDAAWAVGDNQGGLNTGGEAVSTWYEVHLIKRTDTGVVDVMFTTTANRATLPANYDQQRRIGWIRNDSGSNILAFTQVDDHFTLTTPQNDVSTTSSATANSRTITAPPNSLARMRVACLGNTGINAANAVVFSELVETDTAPTTSNGFNSIGAGDFAIIGAAHIELRVNSSSQIRDRSITATGTMAYDISTYGWIDHRRRLSAT